MTVPAFLRVGTYAASNNATSITVTWPTVANNNIAFLLVGKDANGTAITINDPAGWNLVAQAGSDTAYTSKLFWRRCTGTETGTFSVTCSAAGGNGMHMGGFIIVFSGCITSGTPYEGLATSFSNSATTTISNSSITSLGTDRLGVNFYAIGDNIASTPPSGWIERADVADATGNDGELVVEDQSMTTPQTVAASSRTIGTAAPYGSYSMALIPATFPAYGSGQDMTISCQLLGGIAAGKKQAGFANFNTLLTTTNTASFYMAKTRGYGSFDRWHFFKRSGNPPQGVAPSTAPGNVWVNDPYTITFPDVATGVKFISEIVAPALPLLADRLFSVTIADGSVVTTHTINQTISRYVGHANNFLIIEPTPAENYTSAITCTINYVDQYGVTRSEALTKSATSTTFFLVPLTWSIKGLTSIQVTSGTALPLVFSIIHPLIWGPAIPFSLSLGIDTPWLIPIFNGASLVVYDTYTEFAIYEYLLPPAMKLVVRW